MRAGDKSKGDVWWVEPGWRDRMRAECPPGGAGPGQAHRFSALVQPTGSAHWLSTMAKVHRPNGTAAVLGCERASAYQW